MARMGIYHLFSSRWISTLHYSTIRYPGKILELGTGTGEWAIGMGDKYLDADILEIDISPIQPL